MPLISSMYEKLASHNVQFQDLKLWVDSPNHVEHLEYIDLDLYVLHTKYSSWTNI